MSIGSQSEKIVEAVLKELSGRCGIDAALEAIDTDVRAEMEDALRLIVRRILERP